MDSTDSAAALAAYRTSAAPPLRIAVVLDASPPSRWAVQLAHFLAGFDRLAVTAFAASATGPRAQPAGPSAVCRQLLKFARRADADAFEPASRTDAVQPFDGDAVARHDLCIWLANDRPEAIGTRLGMLTATLGSEPGVVPFWSDVANGRVVTPARIVWHEHSGNAGRAARLIETSTTHGVHVTDNATAPLAALKRSLASLCLDLQRDPTGTRATLRRRVETPMASPITRPTCPEAGEVCRFVVKKYLRSAYRRFVRRRGAGRWVIALREAPPDPITAMPRPDLTDLRQLPLPAGSSEIADPFLYEHAGATYLLFEEVPAGTTKGRLSCVKLREDGTYGDFTVVLEREFHLSYPCVFEDGGATYLLPEASDSGRVDLYRFRRFPDDLVFVRTLLDGAPLVDTTPLHHDGIWYLFTTCAANGFSEALLYWSPTLEGPWQLHPASPLSCSVRDSRGAGAIFRDGGRLIRPVQDCSVRYGYAMRFKEITRLSPTEFAERELAWVLPDWAPRVIGTHTWTGSGRWQAVDALRV